MEKDKIIKFKYEYPINENWFHFSEGVEIGDEEINEWIKRVIKGLKKAIKSGKKKSNYQISSGNTIVFGTIHQVSKNSNEYEILIGVAKNYSELCKTIKIK